MSGVTTATVIAGIGAVAAVGSTAYAISQGAPKASGDVANSEVQNSVTQAAQARTALLATAGGSAGSPLAPGQVNNSDKTIFGN